MTGTGRALAARLLLALALLLPLGAPAAIRIDVEGIDGELRRNVDAFLSLERYKDRENLEDDTVARLYGRVDGEVRSALRPLGHYAPQVRTSLEPLDEGRNWRVRIEVDAGPPVVIESVEVKLEGSGATDAVFAAVSNQTVLRKGQTLNHGLYERVKGDMTRIAAANGYLDAQVLPESRMLVDPEARTARITLAMQTGERYHFGAISIEQSVIRPELMRKFLRFREGDPYSTTELLRTQFALDDSLYFSTVEVSPLERDRESLSVPVTISANKSDRLLTLGPGYGTDTGIRATVGWTDSRLNSLGHRLRMEARVSSISRTGEIRYDVPIGDPAIEKFSMALVRREQQISVLDTTELSFTPSVTRVSGSWQRVTSLSLMRTTTDDGGRKLNSSLLLPSISFATVPEGFLGEALFTRGLYVDLIGSQSVLGSRADFLRAHAQFEREFDFSRGWHLLVRGEGGTSLVKDFAQLPGIFRFFAGGDRSVRGFGFNELSPLETVHL
ncbi:hypothetical protein EON77_06180, partial [bacterium]